MTPREFKGQLPPRTAVQSRFCVFLDSEEIPGGVKIGRAYGMLYVLEDGRIVIDPFSRDGAEVPAVFPGMPEGVEIV